MSKTSIPSHSVSSPPGRHKPPVKKTLLVIDDDKSFCQSLADEFMSYGLRVFLAHTGETGLKTCAREKIDIVLLDQNLPGIQGDSLCQPILRYNDQTKIIFITAFPSFDNAVKAIKAGAFDYLSKPIELDELHIAIDKSLDVTELEKVRQFHHYKTGKDKKNNLLAGSFEEHPHILRHIDLAANVDTPLLITGETGTGKNVVAKTIHYSSKISDAPFININCSALPENLVEAELFGHEKGAFTGASSTRKGLFEIADGGTLLLDEIGEMPVHLQSKLLQVLDEGKIRRIGGHALIPVNVRVIASTNANLETMIREKTFREDLYYRLSVLRIHIPPLRERRRDIPLLCWHFIDKYSGGSVPPTEDSEIDKLMNYHWPGNIRELKNIIERSVILHKDRLRPSQFIMHDPPVQTAPAPLNHNPQPTLSPGQIKTLEEMNIGYIKQALQAYGGNYTRTAKALGISLSTLKRRINQYSL